VSRDPRKLDVFADALAVRVYHATRHVPAEERYGLQRQVRRAAISVPCNIIEGCARRTEREYLHFVNIALGSAAETRYLLDLAKRLCLVPAGDVSSLCEEYEGLLKKLQKLQQAIKRMQARTSYPKPKA
jgi:four helix bundle protein